MKIIKNKEVKPNMIHDLRTSLKNDSKETRKLLGTTMSDFTRDLPIKSRKFNLWVILSDLNKVIGYVSFDKTNEDIVFIKSLYITSNFRRQGFATKLLQQLTKEFPKIECRINLGNECMYKFALSFGLKGEKRSKLLPSDKKLPPIWWSNYKNESDYEKF